MKNLQAVLTISALAASAVLSAAANDYLWFSQGENNLGLDVADADSISLSTDGSKILVATRSGSVKALDRSSVARMTYSDFTPAEVMIEYSGSTAKVTNPYAFKGVDVTTDGAHVTVVADTQEEIIYRLSGESADGSLKVYSSFKLELLLDGVDLTNTTGAAINIQTGKKTTLRIPDGTVSNLTDGTTYATTDGEDEKGTLFSEGQIEFRGKGTLNVTGRNKHAICSDDYIEVRNTTVNVLSAKSDGVHVNDYFLMESGRLTIDNIGGDGIDADKNGYITVQSGDIEITVSADSKKGFKTGTDGALTISGGNVSVTTSGAVTVTDGDPSYCTALKSKGDFEMSGGSLRVRASGTAGKGIKADGNARITGGEIDIEVTGAGGTYTNTSSETDSYSSTCISVDSTLVLTGGNLTLATGDKATGGKCIKVDGDATIGDQTDALTLTATTRGARFSVDSSSGGNGGWGGGWGGGPGGGGWGPGWDNGGYSNPKVIKAEGNLTVAGGHLILSATNGEGGEGLESKQTLSITGGTIEISTVDDCINAANHIDISGGRLFFNASQNDAIDSNGTLAISGGIIVALATTQPECGIDCDHNSRFTLTGGTFVAIGGGNNTPSGSGTSQRVATYSVTPSTSETYSFTDASGNLLLAFKCPRSYQSRMNMMVTAPGLKSSGMTVNVLTGATITGGEQFNGMTVGATSTGGNKVTSLTTI